jgi:hypothetical protein
MYHNNDESIKDNFGFKRLGERYKCCVKCRTIKKDYYKANAGVLCDNQYKMYYEPCEICNNKVYKYAMKRHMEVCRQYYKPRDNVV